MMPAQLVITKTWLLVLLSSFAVTVVAKPNIIFILADDLGFNDVGFHGSRQIPTPNIDALAYSGVILNNYYVQPICTPTRSAIMSGMHPIHTGLQHGVIVPPKPIGLPLHLKTLPQALGPDYKKSMIGKWHLGFSSKNHTPTKRGFDSHLGYWGGRIDYYDHTIPYNDMWGHDFRRNMDVETESFGHYATDVFTEEAVSIIGSHDKARPLFLYLAHLAMHTANGYQPLQAPREDVAKFPYINDLNRRIYAGMLRRLDHGVGEIVAALSKKNMLENSIIVFSTDNGGPAAGYGSNRASNWPLRGVKTSLWEGGVRGAGLVWSPLIERPTGTVVSDLFAVEDWYPTLVSAAGLSLEPSQSIDGIDQWPCITKGVGCHRTKLLHNIEPVINGIGVRDGDWKLIHNPSTASSAWDSWFGPSGRNETARQTDLDVILRAVRNSSAGRVVLERNPEALDHMRASRLQAMVNCTGVPPAPSFHCRAPEKPCLFNMARDPCETENLASQYPEVVDRLRGLVNQYNSSAVPYQRAPDEPAANPKYWGYNWVNWKDYPTPI